MFPSTKITASTKPTQFLRPESEGLPQYPDSVMYVSPKTKAILIPYMERRRHISAAYHALPNNYYSFPSQQPLIVSR